MNTGKTGQGKCVHSTQTVHPAKTEWLKEQLVEKSVCHLNLGADVNPSGLCAWFPGVDFLFS